VQTTAEMLDACRAPFTACDLFIAAAAPADFTPESVAEQKIKKGSGQMLTLVPTPDILATLASEKRPGQFIVGFAAETNDVLGYAAEKLTRKKLDLMVANDVTAPGAGFGVDTNIVTLLFPDGRQVPLPQLPKRAGAARILEEFCLAAATQA
jgi:phosphopantothenoylcysteine decarboxylase/phosphopantothenate--cysteine ligase